MIDDATKKRFDSLMKQKSETDVSLKVSEERMKEHETSLKNLMDKMKLEFGFSSVEELNSAIESQNSEMKQLLEKIENSLKEAETLEDSIV